MDTLSRQARSERMSHIRSKDSKPELRVRRLVHSLGYRYRIHSDALVGHPDLVFQSRQKVIFVHGCFWHRHEGCALCRLPKSRLGFWVPKLDGNRERDVAVQAELARVGWQVMIVWECQLRDGEALVSRLRAFLGDVHR